ncbi:MAG: tetratricopeptide repeat protein [Candidatus Omnitrophica bacterium]|jgi:tetratricopeptide (TPR) repeat protein|nr:tetratricopeptide repeat protein [Candidatus Omnitrophota bacterium]
MAIGRIRNYIITAIFITAAFAALRPQIAYLLYRRSGDYINSSLIADAARSYRKTLFFNGKDVDSRNWLAHCYKMLGYKDKAVAEYKTAIAQDPDNVTAYFDLGIIRRSEGDTGSARELFNKALNCGKSANITDEDYKFYTRSARHMLRIMDKYNEASGR